MKRAIHFEQSHGINNKIIHLFFAKPFDACSIMHNKGFKPLARPNSNADEVVILTRIGDFRGITDFKGSNVKIVTADQGSFVYLLGRFLCDESGLNSAEFNYEFAGNEIKALQMLIRKKADVAFILKKTYEGLSSFTRKNVRQVDESVTDFAFHQFCIAPSLKDQADAIFNILMEMENEGSGKQILKDIQFNGWVKPEQGEIQMLKMVYQRYTS
jgi:ABC-type phosphate/phosphonate transport system substrate-binding protein